VLVSAVYSMDDADELLETQLPHGTWDTVGGLMLDLAGRVPDPGDSVEVDGFRLTAVDVRGRRIGRVRIEPTGPRTGAGTGSRRGDEGRGSDAEGKGAGTGTGTGSVSHNGS